MKIQIFWLLLKYQKLWHPWAHILSWPPFPRAESKVWLLWRDVHRGNTAASHRLANTLDVVAWHPSILLRGPSRRPLVSSSLLV